MSQLRKKTIQYINNTNQKYRKKKGQYFTPKKLRLSLLDKLPKKKNPKILDPACGTGEFLLTAKRYFKNAKLTGWEIEEKLVKISRNLIPEAVIKKTNSLLRKEKEKYDFIIGNPPYYELSPSKKIKKAYKQIIKGRTNVYSLFIYKSIKLLKKGGYLAFIVPPSMNNGAYFAALRNFIIENCDIKHLSIQKSSHFFEGASQSVMFLVLRKEKNKKNYIFKKNGILIFSEKAQKLKEIFKNSTTLHELGFKVRTGKLIWNKNKNLLTKNKKKGIPLIWSHNITKKGLNLENNKKPQYVKTKNYNFGPAIVVNRVIGKPGNGQIKAALIPKNMKFIAENHVNVITRSQQSSLFKRKETNQFNLNKILEQLNSPKKTKILQNITGNTQLSKNELEKIFPINY